MKTAKKIILIVCMSVSAICAAAAIFTNYENVGTGSDVLYYKAATTMLFLSFFVCFLTEFVISKINEKKSHPLRSKKEDMYLCSFNYNSSDSFRCAEQ